MRVKALGKQLTFYDEEGNIIGHEPPLPPEDPDEEVRMINIVDFEDRLMGIDPDAKPDFFLDIDELNDFIEKHRKVKFKFTDKFVNVDMNIFAMLLVAVAFFMSLFGFMVMEDIVEARLAM